MKATEMRMLQPGARVEMTYGDFNVGRKATVVKAGDKGVTLEFEPDKQKLFYKWATACRIRVIKQ